MLFFATIIMEVVVTMTLQREDDKLVSSPNLWSTGSQAHSRAFTLIEVLASIGIVMVLVTIAVGAVTIGQRVAKESRAKALLKQLETGLQAYYRSNGFYPQCSSTTVPTILVIAGDDDPAANLVGMLNRFDIPKSDRLDIGTATIPRYQVKSPLVNGDFFYYKCPGTFNPTTFDLGCRGLDGKWGEGTTDEANFGKGDDIVNFKRSK